MYQIMTAGGKAVGPSYCDQHVANVVCTAVVRRIKALGRHLRVAVHGPDGARLTCYRGAEAADLEPSVVELLQCS